jgi:hypothetical protein
MHSARQLIESLDALSDTLKEAPAPWLYEELVGALEPRADDASGEWSLPVLPPSLPDEWMRLAAKALPAVEKNDDEGLATVVVSDTKRLLYPSDGDETTAPAAGGPGPPEEFLPHGSTVHFGPKREDDGADLPFSATVTAALLFALLAVVVLLTMVDCS